MDVLKVKPVFVSTMCILAFGIVFGSLPNSFPNITITPNYVQLNNTGGIVKFTGTVSPRVTGQNLSNFTYHWLINVNNNPNLIAVSGCEVNEVNCTVSVPLTSKTTYFFLQLYAQNKTGTTAGPSSEILEKINSSQSISQPLSIPTPTLSRSTITVGESNQTYTVNDIGASGGTPPYSYEVLMNESPLGSSPGSKFFPAVGFSSNPNLTITEFTQASPGIDTFKVLVKDSTGTEVTSAPVYLNLLAYQGSALSISQPYASSTAVQVNNSITINDSGASGGTSPYRYELLGVLAPNSIYQVARPFSPSSSFTVVPSLVGTYIFKVVAEDSLGAEINSSPLYINVTKFPPGKTPVQTYVCISGNCTFTPYSPYSSCITPSSGYYSSESALVISAEPTCDGYKFIGWTTVNGSVGNGGYSGSNLNTTITPSSDGIIEFAQYSNITNSSTTSPGSILFVGNSLIFPYVVNKPEGPWRIVLQDIGQSNSAGLSPASFAVYYDGILVNVTSIGVNKVASFSYEGHSISIDLLQTFPGLYSYQKWAQFTVSNGTDLYVGGSTLDGPWKITLADLGYPNSEDVSPAAFILYYNGAFAYNATLNVGRTATFEHGNSTLNLTVVKTFPGLYANQKWAQFYLNLTNRTQTLTTTIPPTTISTVPTENVTINIKPGWNLLSVPFGPQSNESLNNIYNAYYELENSCGMVQSQYSKAIWFYSNSNNTYVWPNSNGAFDNYVSTGMFNLISGVVLNKDFGFWFHSTKQCQIEDPTFLSSVLQAYNQSYTENLSVGWNIIGVPFITNSSFKSIASSCSIRGAFYGYNTATNSYYNATTPAVGESYFVYANAPCALDWIPNAGSGSPPSTP
jgi:hypothetical protein